MKTIYSLKKLVPITLLALFFVSCSTNVPMASSQEDQNAKLFKFDKQYANLYIYRDSSHGIVTNIPIKINNKYAGQLKYLSYFKLKRKPGTYAVTMIKGKREKSVTVNLRANNNYFIVANTSMMGFRPKIVSKLIGQKGVLNSKMLQSELSKKRYTLATENKDSIYVSPNIYQKYNCNQIDNQIQTIIDASKIYQVQADNASSQYIMSYSTTPIGQVLDSMTYTGAMKNIYSNKRLISGHYNALKTVSKQKRCNFASKLK